jgi:hypothetical protein
LLSDHDNSAGMLGAVLWLPFENCEPAQWCLGTGQLSVGRLSVEPEVIAPSVIAGVNMLSVPAGLGVQLASKPSMDKTARAASIRSQAPSTMGPTGQVPGTGQYPPGGTMKQPPAEHGRVTEIVEDLTISNRRKWTNCQQLPNLGPGAESFVVPLKLCSWP